MARFQLTLCVGMVNWLLLKRYHSISVSSLRNNCSEFQEQVGWCSSGFCVAEVRWLGLQERWQRGCALHIALLLLVLVADVGWSSALLPCASTKQRLGGGCALWKLLEPWSCIKKMLLIWSSCAASSIQAPCLAFQPALASLCIFKFFQEIRHYDWLHYLQFFVSFDACASSAYVKGLDDIEW